MAIYSEFSHWKWCFSIVMLVYQRVCGSADFSSTSAAKSTLPSSSISPRHQDTLWTHACPETRLAGKLDPWKSGWIKIWAEKKDKKGTWLQFWSRFFFLLWQPMLYTNVIRQKSGRVNLNRCAGSQMLIHGYNLMALSPCHFEGETQTWFWSNQFRCHLDLGAICPQWPDLPNYGSPLIPLPGERNPQRIQVSRCRRRLKALAVKSSDPIGSRGQVTWCYSLPQHGNRRFT